MKFIAHVEQPGMLQSYREVEAENISAAYDQAKAALAPGEFMRGVTEVEEIEVRVPGAVFYECFDPMATEYPREASLPKPERRRVGKGSQYRYRVPPAQARDMLEHAEIFGEAISFGVDDPRAGRMVVRWVARERARLGWS